MNKVGSLYFDGKQFLIGPSACMEHLHFMGDNKAHFGPAFDSIKDFHLHNIANKIRRIKDGEEVELSFLMIADIVHILYPDERRSKGPFFMCHPDAKGDHILIHGDKAWLIDLTGTWFTSAQEAFAAPDALIDVRAFYNGSNELGPAETDFAVTLARLHHPLLAQHVRKDKPFQRLQHLLAGDSLHDPEQWWVGLRALALGVGYAGVNESMSWDEGKSFLRFKFSVEP
ncbi:hypothetical protein DACRYDRAFT_22439 [Dacryopinax primogenitus]|uniref:Aminoglycoside phosphotransferase domain-containing protein n=1 Tax=Dacryopinax primogenitus (strain DJM 731) TaxID=1858805 RepID=M5FW16_DACPD|nr:uncharacterized protein DACRYDRAFT_22439 [Dacryopinax primogenitus]EJU02056.1 hypothetical protein DACRYDRAFT_22439 [Dacryopinax primogenitus]